MANTARMANPVFVAKLKHRLRFSPHATMPAGDGLSSPASGSPALPDWLGPRLFDPMFTTTSKNVKHARQIASSSGIAVFSGAGATSADGVQAGRACQRFALQATALWPKPITFNLNQIEGDLPDRCVAWLSSRSAYRRAMSAVQARVLPGFISP